MDDDRVLNAVLDDMVRYTMLLHPVLPKAFKQRAARLRAARPSLSVAKKVMGMCWRRLVTMTYNGEEDDGGKGLGDGSFRLMCQLFSFFINLISTR